MQIYIILVENGEYEDTNKEVYWVGTDEEKAYQIVSDTKAETVYFEIWDVGECMSSYMREYIKPDGLGRGDYFSKWERNYGVKNYKLEGVTHG